MTFNDTFSETLGIIRGALAETAQWELEHSRAERVGECIGHEYARAIRAYDELQRVYIYAAR